MRTIKASVILSSGSSITHDHYTIENVKRFSTIGSNYYYIETETEEYYFPIDRTVIKVIKHK